MSAIAARAIAVEADGTLWVAGAGGRLLAIDPEGRARVVAEGLDDPGALDAGAGVVWVACAGSWTRIDARSGELTRFDAGAVEPAGLAVDAEAQTLWLADAGSGQIVRARLPGAALLGPPIPLAGARGLALAPDRRRVYAACASGVAAIDTADGAVVTVADTASFADLDDARALTVTPAGLAVAGGRRGLIGVNHRHGTAVTVWREDLEHACDVGFDRRDKSYVVADERAGLVRVARDGSRADPIAVSA